jgi:hypothetical protein|tara:strand:- start:1089 stop:1430 length:342 start_codon:yes stop_codon:yes gene_type:complete
MRNIDKNSAVALYESKGFRGGNTVVTKEGVWLHGNQIVRIMPEGNLKDSTLVQFTLCGWDTPTTRARINAVLEIFEGKMSLKKIKGQTYLVDYMDKTQMPIDEDQWYYTKVEV